MSLQNLASLLAKYAVLPGAVLYFMGSIYTYYFFNSIGADASDAGYDTATVMTWSIQSIIYILKSGYAGAQTLGALALANWPWALLILAGSIALIASGVRLFVPIRKRTKKLTATLKPWIHGARPALPWLSLVVIVLALFFLSRSAGIERGEEVLKLGGYPVTLTFASNVIVDPKLKYANENCLTMAAETTHNIIVVCRANDLCNETTFRQVFVLPREAVAYRQLKIKPTGQSSGGCP
jgi:hypothetical protein